MPFCHPTLITSLDKLVGNYPSRATSNPQIFLPPTCPLRKNSLLSRYRVYASLLNPHASACFLWEHKSGICRYNQLHIRCCRALAVRINLMGRLVSGELLFAVACSLLILRNKPCIESSFRKRSMSFVTDHKNRRNSNVRKEQTMPQSAGGRSQLNAARCPLVVYKQRSASVDVWLVGWTQITISQKQAQNNATLLRVCSPVKSEAHGDSLVAKW
ncbi:hypothetical protein CEXT_814551 [Caerostris extrusa]|uniref:Uncharacterized protein n=1 Tax=Caerostris extrusa TaxID=172846 RepID=A0AAV4MH00_CAEEX|nr:hypothetical protein CEXT_814551 [Caerostris extrusa]